MRHPCFLCGAGHRGPYLYSDVRQNPSWRFRQYTHQQFMDAHAGARMCPLLQVKGFHFTQIRTCTMHCINLGFGCVLNGCVLLELVLADMFGGPELTLDQKLHAAWVDFRLWAQEHGVPTSQPRLTPGMLGLKSRSVNADPELDTKAYNGRCVTAWLAEAACGAALVDQSPWAKLRATSIWALAALYHHMESNPMRLSHEAAAELERYGMVALQAFNNLAVRAVRQGITRWTVKPKNHRIHHVLREVRTTRGVPKSCPVSSCFSESDCCCMGLARALLDLN